MSKRNKNDAMALRVVKSQDEARFTLGLVYRADVAPGMGADGFNDLVKAKTLEGACWKFMSEHQDVGLLHADGTSGSGTVVECSISRAPQYTMKASDGSDAVVSPGDWLLGVIWQPAAWRLIKSGAVTGYSFQGSAARRRVR